MHSVVRAQPDGSTRTTTGEVAPTQGINPIREHQNKATLWCQRTVQDLYAARLEPVRRTAQPDVAFEVCSPCRPGGREGVCCT